MSACITTRSPTSYQLRLAAVNCRKYSSPSVFLLMRGHKPDRQIRCFSVSRDNVTHQRTGSKFSLNAFSGWSGDDNGSEVLNESPPKKGWSGGIVGAAVAGVVLVAGLAFATLSISKRASGPKQNMETLTTHQEESLTSADQNDNVEDEGAERETAVVDDSRLEDKTGTPKSDVHDDSVDASSIENLGDSLVAEKLESSDKLKEDPADYNIIDSLVTDVNSANPDTDYQEVDAAINGSDKSTLPSPLISLLDNQRYRTY
ncbi:hypothetical protein L6452_05189 [Arctium lappa]|uniref:Uncharacterized protein n=1 Tax=Arctium lappa TaxID=4217 RepID=A0ACB9EGS6_ARCLA|nr:hypothetical protein L6452_05189 [Arctium lappa]